jgi:hypothetical protein
MVLTVFQLLQDVKVKCISHSEGAGSDQKHILTCESSQNFGLKRQKLDLFLKPKENGT